MKARSAITAKSAFRSIDGLVRSLPKFYAARYGDAVICACGAAGIEGTAKPFRSEHDASGGMKPEGGIPKSPVFATQAQKAALNIFNKFDMKFNNC